MLGDSRNFIDIPITQPHPCIGIERLLMQKKLNESKKSIEGKRATSKTRKFVNQTQIDFSTLDCVPKKFAVFPLLPFSLLIHWFLWDQESITFDIPRARTHSHNLIMLLSKTTKVGEKFRRRVGVETDEVDFHLPTSSLVLINKNINQKNDNKYVEKKKRALI